MILYLVQAPSFNAGTNSLRKEKGVCGKNLCGFFLRDFNQRPISNLLLEVTIQQPFVFRVLSCFLTQ